jgi:hypothetical protein
MANIASLDVLSGTYQPERCAGSGGKNAQMLFALHLSIACYKRRRLIHSLVTSLSTGTLL